MLKARFTGSFKKNRTRMKKSGKDMYELNEVMRMLINEQPLPSALCDHPLHGEYTGKRECHIEDDWLLIYKVRPEAGTVTFHHTGTHSDLFKQ